MATIDLLNTALWFLWKPQYLWSMDVQSAIKWGMPVMYLPLGVVGKNKDDFLAVAGPWLFLYFRY